MKNEKVISVYWDGALSEYTIEEVKEAFNFAVEPDYNRIREIRVCTGKDFMEIEFETDKKFFIEIKVYDKINGSYVESINKENTKKDFMASSYVENIKEYEKEIKEFLNKNDLDSAYLKSVKICELLGLA